MSDLDVLRTLGDQLVPPPLDSLVEAARRRDRRSAAATALVAGAAVAGIATGVLLLTPDEGDRDPQPTETPTQVAPTSRPLTYADGSTLHYGDQTVATEGDVVELEVTDYGVTYRTTDGRIWFTDGSPAEQVGELGEPGWSDRELQDGGFSYNVGDRIVSGNLGVNSAWFEFPRPDAPEIVVYDTREQEVLARAPVQIEAGGLVAPHSVDEGSAYWFLDPDPTDDDSLPQMRLDLATGEQAPVTPDDYLADMSARPERTLVTSHAEKGFKVHEITTVYEWNFSVGDGSVTPEGMQPLDVRDGLTGTRLEFDVPQRVAGLGWFSQWLDDDSIVLAVKSRQAADLLECRFSTGVCEVALADLPTSIVVPEFGDLGRI